MINIENLIGKAIMDVVANGCLLEWPTERPLGRMAVRPFGRMAERLNGRTAVRPYGRLGERSNRRKLGMLKE